MACNHSLTGRASPRWRAPVRPSQIHRDLIVTDKQIALVETFADQAAIAIENVRLFEAEQERTRELTESLEQQTATAKVLEVISRSAFDLQTVLDTLVVSAARLCDADRACIFQRSGEVYRWVANFGFSPELIAYADAHPFTAGLRSTTSRVALEGKPIHNPDVLADPNYTASEYQRLGNYRTMLGVPLLREGTPIGIFILTREQVRPFTDRQIELVTSFADQAVIAIENVRLFEAEQQRTRELSESLEQQTATSEVLQVISSSPGDLKPVFATMLANAARICEASFGSLAIREGNAFRRVALHNAPPEFVEFNERSPLFDVSVFPTLTQIMTSKQAVHITDLQVEGPDNPLVKYAGARTLLVVPLLKADDITGIFGIYRREVRPFTDKQIELARNFAAQAVIAIENARLLSELRQRTDDLTESLEQQTATSEVLHVISSSPGDLKPVFESLLANATRICEANFGMLYRFDDGVFRAEAVRDAAPAFVSYLRSNPPRADPRNALGRVLQTKQPVHVIDIKAEPAYAEREPARVATVELAGARIFLAVPLLKEDQFIGCIAIYRKEVRPFSDKQIALVTSFANQAVIAIENTRLLNELRQRTDELGRSVGELRALGEVSQAVNSTLDLETVLSTIVAKAVQLSNTEAGAIYVFDEVEHNFRLRATYGMDRELIDALKNQHIGRADANLARGEPI
jgi:GAF domain-containing protein